MSEIFGLSSIAAITASALALVFYFLSSGEANDINQRVAEQSERFIVEMTGRRRDEFFPVDDRHPAKFRWLWQLVLVLAGALAASVLIAWGEVPDLQTQQEAAGWNFVVGRETINKLFKIPPPILTAIAALLIVFGLKIRVPPAEEQFMLNESMHSPVNVRQRPFLTWLGLVLIGVATILQVWDACR